MEPTTLALIVIVTLLALINGALVWLFLRTKKETPDQNSLVLMQNSMQDLSRTLHERLGETVTPHYE